MATSFASIDLAGHVVLVTGATDGLGRGVAIDLARRGATVLVHGRDAARIAATLADVKAAGPGAPHRTYAADLASLRQARAMAEEVLARERGSTHS